MIGIDPGITGAWSVISPTKVEVFDLPVRVVKEPGKKKGRSKKKPAKGLRVIDAFALFKSIKGFGPTRIIIEEVGSRPTDARATAFTFGMTYDAVLNAALACDCPVTLVRPQAWKKKFGLIGKGKEASLPVARSKYPALLAALKRKKDHNRADAVLIGSYT